MDDEGKKSIRADISNVISEINNIANTTKYNNKNLLDGTFKESFVLGNENYQYGKKEITIDSCLWNNIYGTEEMDFSDEGIQNAIDKCKEAIGKISFQRSKLGSTQNTMEHYINYLESLENQVIATYNMIFGESGNDLSEDESIKMAKSWNSTVKILNCASEIYEQINEELMRMETLADQASNDTMSDSERELMQIEVDELLENIKMQIPNTVLANRNIFDGSFSYIDDMTFESLGISGGSILTQEKAAIMLGKVNNAKKIIEDRKNKVDSKLNEINSYSDLMQEAEHGCAFKVNKIVTVEEVTIGKEYEDKLKIIDGELVYIGDDKNEIKWAIEMGIKTN